jgi:hypothetical protein
MLLRPGVAALIGAKTKIMFRRVHPGGRHIRVCPKIPLRIEQMGTGDHTVVACETAGLRVDEPVPSAERRGNFLLRRARSSCAGSKPFSTKMPASSKLPPASSRQPRRLVVRLSAPSIRVLTRFLQLPDQENRRRSFIVFSERHVALFPRIAINSIASRCTNLATRQSISPRPSNSSIRHSNELGVNTQSWTSTYSPTPASW